ncbi:hypothetical protein BAY13_17110 [Elizabethkingia bruuniana]|uniref:TlpA family protein disulfide reductase n=1 Tax=Elizabethkingia bruuniana TaxID=1756149 RepID=UPI00099A83C6|nr:TlpA disulfide reductase family protein [Elizabethkingia bruuniana]OPC66454.1 hypothetical protein BAY13_17110 [Elizabethkingia bruuniana]
MKIYLKVTTVVLFLMFISSQSNSQKLKALKIGDKVPDVYLAEMLNYKKGSAKLSEFMDTPLIIDFWFVNCASCVKQMPHLDSIQKKYAGKLQLLLSTHEPKEKVVDFFKNNKHVKGLTFTQTVLDSVLKQLFPTPSFPHQIWISKSGIVKAITDGSTATNENIEKFIRGESFDFIPKIGEELDPAVRFSANPMILYNYDENKNKIIRYSYLSKWRSEFNGGVSYTKIDTINYILRYCFRNTHFLYLYNYAYNGGEEGKDTTHINTRFIRKDNSILPTVPDFLNIEDEYYNYDLICRYDSTPGGYKKAVMNNMVNDLDNAFNIKSHEEVRRIKCLILKEYGKSKNYQKPVGNGKGYQNNTSELKVGNKVVIENIMPTFFLNNLNYSSQFPILNETKYNRKMSFEFTWNPYDIEIMSKELNKYGLNFVFEERERRVIILENR